MTTSEKPAWRALALSGAVFVALALVTLELPWLPGWLRAVVLLGMGAVGVWLAWRAGRALLWRVGRRLAFSYLLIGVVPIPMLALLLVLSVYLLSGFFLGHLYRDALKETGARMIAAAHERLIDPDYTPAASPDLTFAVYHDGRRTEGDSAAPASWPEWLELDHGGTTAFAALTDGQPTLVATALDGERSALAIFTGDLEQTLAAETGVAVRLFRSDDQARKRVRLTVGDIELSLEPFSGDRRYEERSALFEQPLTGLPMWQRPLILWGEISGPVRSLADGSIVYDYVVAGLNGSPALVYDRFFSSSPDLDTAAGAGMIGIVGLLAMIYCLALMMALLMIFSISRAVNQLNKGTDAVRAGDFSIRIPSRRRDQLGELQRSFNQMAGNLEQLVENAAEQEAVAKELQVARELQESLLPTDLPRVGTVEFATLFEPSAAIGGDYFDVVRLDDSRLAVVIADVSGHGLPTGLRMAMLKAALTILFEESKPTSTILDRLSAIIRQSGDRRYFATATIARIDFRRNLMEIDNAGHPPTYLLRNGEVEEILLPGNPLGMLGDRFGSGKRQLSRGDFLVWLSDGLVEATNGDGEPFGYERIREVLTGSFDSADDVKQALVDAVREHGRGSTPDDDRTLVVMHYFPSSSSAEKPSLR